MDLIELEDKKWSPTEIIEQLKAQVTPERWTRIQKVVQSRNPNFVTVLENIYDRGNASAVMRSAEAFGFYKFHQINETEEFKESKRVTQGADKWLIQQNWLETQSCVDHLKTQGFEIWVTHLEGGTPIEETPLTKPVALFFGNERQGASPLLTEICDRKVYIPMQGFVQSFNISVAAALCFQTMNRRLSQKSSPPLSDAERQYLTALYLYRSLKNPGLI